MRACGERRTPPASEEALSGMAISQFLFFVSRAALQKP
jgi:hypothetical protein